MAFKMKKGSPMYRNFGIGGSPVDMASKKSPAMQDIDLSKKTDKELTAIAKRNIAKTDDLADNSIYGPSKETRIEFANNPDYGGIASDSIQAVGEEIRTRFPEGAGKVPNKTK